MTPEISSLLNKPEKPFKPEKPVKPDKPYRPQKHPKPSPINEEWPDEEELEEPIQEVTKTPSATVTGGLDTTGVSTSCTTGADGHTSQGSSIGSGNTAVQARGRWTHPDQRNGGGFYYFGSPVHRSQEITYYTGNHLNQIVGDENSEGSSGWPQNDGPDSPHLDIEAARHAARVLRSFLKGLSMARDGKVVYVPMNIN